VDSPPEPELEPVELGDPLVFVDSWVLLDSCEPLDCVEVESASGARSAAFMESGEPLVVVEEVVDEDEEDNEERCELSPACAAFAPVVLLPGNALAAASAKTPVNATLPASSQRLARCSRRRAASRAWERVDMG
jgi:hypothetical protein